MQSKDWTKRWPDKPNALFDKTGGQQKQVWQEIDPFNTTRPQNFVSPVSPLTYLINFEFPRFTLVFFCFLSPLTGYLAFLQHTAVAIY